MEFTLEIDWRIMIVRIRFFFSSYNFVVPVIAGMLLFLQGVLLFRQGTT